MSENPFERRRSERRYALKFLDYEILSEDGKVTGRGLARTLNISETGLRLETSQFFEAGQRLRITIGLDNELVQVDGRVANSVPEGEELCRTGVMFIAFSDDAYQTYRKYFSRLKSALES